MLVTKNENDQTRTSRGQPLKYNTAPNELSSDYIHYIRSNPTGDGDERGRERERERGG